MTLTALFAKYNAGINAARIEYARTLEHIARQERREALPKRPRIKSGCGSLGGFMRHKRGNTPVCDACRIAKRAYERERYRIRKGHQ